MKKALITALIATLIAITVFLSSSVSSPNIGSVARGGEFQSYIASSTNASATAGTLVKTGSGTVGSIVITQAASTGAYFRIWDATSTATSTYQGSDNTSTTTTYGRLVAQLKTAAGENTYTFDANLFKGLVIEVPTSWNGIATITYR